MRVMAVLLLALLAFGGFYVVYLREHSSSESTASLPEVIDTTNPCECEIQPKDYVKSLSCSMTACHGAINPAETDTGLLRNEYRIWFDSDPHANACRVLGNEVSKRMVAHLVGDSPSTGKYEKIYVRCLACHNTPGAKAPEELVQSEAYFDQDDRFEGVGCEVCHGQASEWKDIHYFDCWKEFSAQEKQARGLEDTKTLTERAKICVRCHVGESGRDVDHDLIAAGHPQMKFEMLGYHTLMPHHWNDKRDHFKGFETELWSAGQIASASAALALLENRTERARDPQASWPEFSEYDCFACHHDLQHFTWRRDRGFTPGNHRVLLPWGVWHFAMLPELAGAEDAKGQEFADALDTLEATMQGSVLPDVKLVKAQAAAAREALAVWSQKESPAELAARLSSFLHEREASGQSLRNWDEAVQLYLAAYAVLKSQSGADEAWQESAKKVREGLGFPAGYQSPHDFPLATGEKDEVQNRLSDLLNDLPKPPP